MLATKETTPDITANSILLLVRFRRPGNHRKVNPGLVEVDADRDAIGVAKELLDSPELKQITSFDGQVRRWLYARSLPAYGVLRDGAYRLPLSLVEEVETHLRQCQKQRGFLVEVFLNVYPTRAAAAKARLRSLYDPRDYPALEELRAAFGFEYRYLTFGVPAGIPGELQAQEMAKAAADIRNEMEEIKQALRASFAALVSHAAERLRPGKDGKPLVFRDSLVKNLEEFFTYFQQRNIVGDGELADLVAQARQVMNGVGPQMLRDQETLRQQVQKTMAGIKQAMDAGLMLPPRRKLTPKED